MLRLLPLLASACVACTGSSRTDSANRTTGDRSEVSDSTNSNGPGAIAASPSGAALTGLLKEGQSFGTTAGEIRGHLGQPDSVVLDPIPNLEEEGQPDTIIRLYYAIGVFGVYRITKGHHDVLNEVAVDTTGVPPGPGIHVGTSRQDVVSVLGRPHHIDRDRSGVETLEYERREDGATVRLLIFEGVVRRIEWNFPVPDHAAA